MSRTTCQTAGVSLRHAVLGLLAIEPTTGYDLARKFESSLSNAWHASHSQIYPELARLTEAGMVEVVGEGARNSRTYAVTEAGREELRDWMVNREPNRSQRSETAVRWFLVALLEPEDRRAALERELENAADHARMLDEIAAQIDALDHPHPFRPTVDLGQRTTAVMRDWLQEQLDSAEADREPG
jgi:PadR family transcriptional regulator, regulatory protein AphA